MSSNPFESALSIDIRVSRRLLALLFGFCIVALTAIWLSALSPILKIVFTLALTIYTTVTLQRYGFDLIERYVWRWLKKSRLGAIAGKRPATAIIGMTVRKENWQIRLANQNDLVATLKLPIWRWRYFMVLRFSILASDYSRTLSFLVTPWQINRDSFRLLYARLDWAMDGRRDG